MTEEFKNMLSLYEKDYFRRNEHLEVFDPEIICAIRSAIRESYLFGFNAGYEADRG